MSQALRSQPQKDCSWAFAKITKNLYLEKEAVDRNST
jgi:hypothetical protein